MSNSGYANSTVRTGGTFGYQKEYGSGLDFGNPSSSWLGTRSINIGPNVLCKTFPIFEHVVFDKEFPFSVWSKDSEERLWKELRTLVCYCIFGVRSIRPF